MTILHNLGFPNIGAQRELKFALESYWRGESDLSALRTVGATLRRRHWDLQKNLDFVPVGDFSFYDRMLDTSFMLGNLPERVLDFHGDDLDKIFLIARGRSSVQSGAGETVAGEMTKWFNTNYHYIVPEFTAHTAFALNAAHFIAQIEEVEALGIKIKPVIIGPVTYLHLGKIKDGGDKLSLLPKLLPVYAELLEQLAAHGAEYVQIDEPILSGDLNENMRQALNSAYHHLKSCRIKILLTTYFGGLEDNVWIAANLPVSGLHVEYPKTDAEIQPLLNLLPEHKILSLGIINGRNIWKTDLTALIDRLQPLSDKLQNRLWLAPSCSLLHVPTDLSAETALDPEIKSWLAFAVQKLDELKIVGRALNEGRETVADILAENQRSIVSRRHSARVHCPAVKENVARLHDDLGRRKSPFAVRRQKQQAILNLPQFPTTTIGSFPQTDEIRRVRRDYKNGTLTAADYENAMKKEIAACVKLQEKIGLDVLVHGEAERNDMVEYFGEQLQGYAFTQNGWVQSYGSRCVKPPILFGDIARKQPMTVSWIKYAQSLTEKPMKGMLTGPVTILNWSFVRDDQPREISCRQLAAAMREEVLDLERAGIRIIQIDEAALREGLPLRKAERRNYLIWAVACFRITANGVRDETQIHTHMCYSEFNDILPDIAAMDADVITIEAARSDMELLTAFGRFAYPNDIGPGIYDIHSPNIPETKRMIDLLHKAGEYISADRLWVNPDCGLKTRRNAEVIPSLKNMVAAAKLLRARRSAS